MLDSLKPYKGGADALWRLHELNKIDKHRLLLTACVTSDARSMTPAERETIVTRFLGSHPNRTPPDLTRTLKAVIPVPLKAGDKLYTVPHSEMDQQMNFHFDVAFNEPQIMECKPVVEALHEMANLVGKIVLDFDPLLK